MVKVPYSNTSPGPSNGSCFTIFCALPKKLSASWSFSLHASRQQAGVNQPSPPFAPPSCPYSSISSDLVISFQWDLTSQQELAPDQSDTAPFWVISSGVPGAGEVWPCCGHGLFPPHALITAAAGAGQGAEGPQICFLPGGQKWFLPLQLSVECCSLAVLKLLEALHSLQMPLK